ncbi:unnamed protein product [Protopolystoma xenopodis]|uniref:Uncharacterized protein n=1 Tax=Protopolystoma xenopodis TaxID=117903 RepID=A0A448WWW8_9PLAT|nr:unnamed protein product [Protopolystoma xenopodis]
MTALIQRTTLLEMKELNERERANHAQQMYKVIRDTTGKLEARNLELEAKVAELTKVCLNQQEEEQKLREQLAGATEKKGSELN